MDIKQEQQDAEDIVPNVSIKVELDNDFIDVEDIKTEFLRGDCSDFSIQERANELLQLETSIKVGSNSYVSSYEILFVS